MSRVMTPDDETQCLAYAIRWLEFEKACPALADTFTALSALMADKSLFEAQRRALLRKWLRQSSAQIKSEYALGMVGVAAFLEAAKEHFDSFGVGAIIGKELGW